MAEKSSTGRTGRPPKVPGERPTRQRIFDSAVDMFSERGYDRTSVRDIAKAAGITESAVYRHYPTKEAILEAAFEYAEKRVYTPVRSNEALGKPSGDALFRDMFRTTIRVLLSDPYLIKILHIMFIEMYHNEGIRDHLKREYGERADLYTENLLKVHLKDGAIGSRDPRALAVLFNRFRFAWLFQTFIMDPRPGYDIDELERELEGPIRIFEGLIEP